MTSSQLLMPVVVFLISCILIVVSSSTELQDPDLEPDGRCVKRRFDEVRTFYYGDNAQPITILTSDRVTHKVVSSILVIYIELSTSGSGIKVEIIVPESVHNRSSWIFKCNPCAYRQSYRFV
jgi:hypothetical protein